MNSKQKTRKGFKIAALAVLGVWAALLLMPLPFGFLNGGMLFLIPVAAAFLIILRPKFMQRLANRLGVLYKMGIAALILLGVLFALLSVRMAADSAKPTDEQAGTVVVLGCKVENGQPSEMLRRRLDKAIEWLQMHPETAVIVSGGEAKDGIGTEGGVMRDYLLAQGIAPQRIFTDELARTTQENMRRAAQLIKENGLDSRIVVVTDRFHQKRAALFASQAGLNSTPLCCKTEPLFAVLYWCRELFALSRALLFGY